jgi:ankyrin repeat protein
MMMMMMIMIIYNYDDDDDGDVYDLPTGWTPLAKAAFFNQPEVCRLLLSRGARVDEKDSDCYGCVTPLSPSTWFRIDRQRLLRV